MTTSDTGIILVWLDIQYTCVNIAPMQHFNVIRNISKYDPFQNMYINWRFYMYWKNYMIRHIVGHAPFYFKKLVYKLYNGTF